MFDEVYDRRRFLSDAATTFAAAGLGAFGSMKPDSAAVPRLPIEGKMPALNSTNGWLNSQPLKSGDLGDKVVLIDFCTYTCINWQRQLPYVRAWATKYADHGLVVIGVHTPEFSFEKNVDNVRRILQAMHVEYPIVIDNDYTIWRAFDNEYWPALYFADAQGRIRHHVFGEGEYQQSERIIQQLLTDSGGKGISHELASVDPVGAEVQADWGNLRSAENYVGYQRTEDFSSPGGAVPDKPHLYTLPERLRLNSWALAGNWTMQREATVLNEPGGRVAYRFHARDLHLVMGSGVRGNPVRFHALIDGQSAGAIHGSDVDQQGNGTVTEPRMYQLIRQSSQIVDRQFEIQFLAPDVQIFSFTFG